MTLSNIAEVVDRLGRPKEALDLVDEARGIFHELAQKLNKDERFEQNRAHNDRSARAVRKPPRCQELITRPQPDGSGKSSLSVPVAPGS